MIILAHLAMFAALYGLGFPALHAAFGDSVNFQGGLIALAVMTVLSEVVTIASALVARAISVALGINPLLQRRKAETVAYATIGIMMFLLYTIATALAPAIITLTWFWSLAVTAAVLGLLEVMVRVKRKIISSQP